MPGRRGLRRTSPKPADAHVSPTRQMAAAATGASRDRWLGDEDDAEQIHLSYTQMLAQKRSPRRARFPETPPATPEVKAPEPPPPPPPPPKMAVIAGGASPAAVALAEVLRSRGVSVVDGGASAGVDYYVVPEAPPGDGESVEDLRAALEAAAVAPRAAAPRLNARGRAVFAAATDAGVAAAAARAVRAAVYGARGARANVGAAGPAEAAAFLAALLIDCPEASFGGEHAIDAATRWWGLPEVATPGAREGAVRVVALDGVILDTTARRDGAWLASLGGGAAFGGTAPRLSRDAMDGVLADMAGDGVARPGGLGFNAALVCAARGCAAGFLGVATRAESRRWFWGTPRTLFENPYRRQIGLISHELFIFFRRVLDDWRERVSKNSFRNARVEPYLKNLVGIPRRSRRATTAAATRS